ncbi:MAG TPA: phosphatidylglycerol lysyltransferase domain-containing protein [Patescibacteria group bacterium]|nr:phosphatidylglycerol lysyltransferase domain-containing protein [Patescibacteria group bacterium]
MVRLKKLTAADKKIFAEFFRLRRHSLAAYSFESVYIWKGLFDIRWAVINGNLCVFFKDKIGMFLYLPPQGSCPDPSVVAKAFRIMDQQNRNPQVSRIQNVEEQELAFYENQGYVCRHTASDYLCSASEMAQLRGNRFKSKRASVNYFIKHYPFEYEVFSLRHKGACLALYHLWMRQRQDVYHDPLYRGMLKDSLSAFEVLLGHYGRLDCLGRLVKVNGAVKAVTFGYALNPDIFCVLYEIADLSIKGLSQFVFRAFCKELEKYRFVNVMDDSGLANLKKVKLSYHPAQIVGAYSVERTHAQAR